jgi:DegV family protein with EDD domain
MELKEKYPDRRIECIDSLTASAGEGLLVYLVNEKKNAGADLDEAAEYARSAAKGICHWFTVDDLVYLKRGGRVSPTVAFVGNLLGIKPVLHVDDAGHLVNVSKARGRKNALAALMEQYEKLALDTKGTVFFSQADCREEVEAFAKALTEKYGAQVKYIADIGPVIGAHAGPGTVAVFFEAKAR